MKLSIARVFTFEAAHRLPKTPVGHKCHTMHGHSYRMTVEVEGAVDDAGMITDFNNIDYWATDRVVSKVDHRPLNDVPGLENPTLEVFVPWIWQQLFPVIPGLKSVEVCEGPHSMCKVST